jgi:hypothetical protein
VDEAIRPHRLLFIGTGKRLLAYRLAGRPGADLDRYHGFRLLELGPALESPGSLRRLSLAARDLHGHKCWSVSDLIETWQGAAMPASPAARGRYLPDKSHLLHIPHIPRAVFITCQRGIYWAK